VHPASSSRTCDRLLILGLLRCSLPLLLLPVSLAVLRGRLTMNVRRVRFPLSPLHGRLTRRLLRAWRHARIAGRRVGVGRRRAG